MQKTYTHLVILLLLITVSGCSNFKFPWVYTLRVQQGNYVEQDMIAQIQEGMSKRQVQYIMGTPIIQDTFHPDRWDYYFSVRHDDKILKEYHYKMIFENDALVKWDGSYETTAKTKQEQEAEALETTRKNDAKKF